MLPIYSAQESDSILVQTDLLPLSKLYGIHQISLLWINTKEKIAAILISVHPVICVSIPENSRSF